MRPLRAGGRDAYGGYDAFFKNPARGLIEVACWAHARRHLYKALESDQARMGPALLLVAQLYRVEQQARPMTPEDRLQIRQRQSRLILDKLRDYLREIQGEVLPKSPAGRAVSYSLKNWTALNRYCDDGDLEIDTLSTLYYSLSNMASSTCQFELVVVGDFPDTRYFSISVNDMHYSLAQHLADLDIDPVGAGGSSYANPFVVGSSGSSPAYTGSQAYLVPISLGSVPGSGSTAGCGITPFEGDNLLDATQRHLSIDWNTSLQGPSVSSGLATHIVDTPTHTNPNTAGAIMVRSYLSPYTCTGSPGTCSANPAPSQPYVIVRDATTGCAYSAQNVANYILYQTGNPVTSSCNLGSGCPTPTTAVISTVDPSASNSGWLSQGQKGQHKNDADITPQSCYTNGSTASSFPNKVAWARSSEWVGLPGPDDAYIGGAVGTTDLGNMANGAACTQSTSGDGCVIRLRFRLADFPSTPFSGTLSSTNMWLRYMSMTLYYQSSSSNEFISDPDGADASHDPVSLVSLADAAFASSGNSNGNFVTFLINVANSPNGLPTRFQQSSGTGITNGIQPIATSTTTYSAWTKNGYTVLDLSQFGSFSTSNPLLLTIRNTLPSSTFNCSGFAVPFNTAEFTNVNGNGEGLMGPFVPLVDYVDPYSLPTSASSTYSIPDHNYCGVVPAASPNLNAPSLTSGNCVSNCLDFPNQYWSSSSTAPPNLYCPSTNPTEPTTAIEFVGTQFPTPAITWAAANSVVCNTATQPNPCNQVVVQGTETTEGSSPASPWQSPVPLTIVGTGFGTPPQLLPYVGSASALTGYGSTTPLTISDDGNGSGTVWDTTSTNCQVYIANWTDSSISMLVNLPVNVQNDYEALNASSTYLLPQNDYNWLSFQAPSNCPIGYNATLLHADKLTFTVVNPQNGSSSSATPVTVSPTTTTGTALH